MSRTLICSWCEHRWEIDDAAAEAKTVACPECGTDADPVVDSVEYKTNRAAFEDDIRRKTANTKFVLPPRCDPEFYANNPDTLFVFATYEGYPKAEIQIQTQDVIASMSGYAGRPLMPLIIFPPEEWTPPEGAGNALEDPNAAGDVLSIVMGTLMERYQLSEEEIMQFAVAPWPDPYRVVFAIGPQRG